MVDGVVIFLWLLVGLAIMAGVKWTRRRRLQAGHGADAQAQKFDTAEAAADERADAGSKPHVLGAKPLNQHRCAFAVAEQITNSNPAIIEASQKGDLLNFSVRAHDCSEPGGDCGFAIVGESNYQPMLRRIAKKGRTFRAVLMPEPDNPYDPNAIMVWAEDGGPIGHLSRENAIEYREVFALLTQHGHVGICRAKLIGGTPGKRSLGVLIDLRDTEDLLTDIRDSLARGTAVSDNVNPF